MSRIAGALFALTLSLMPAIQPPAAARAQAEEEPGPAETVARAEVLGLSPEMEAFLAAQVGGGTDDLRLHSLMDALFERGKLDVSYSNERTTTAARTFELRTGNCLSFTLMFAAMARQVGLEVRFREVGEVLSWDRRGSVLLNNKHLFTEVVLAHSVVAVDFLPGAEKRYRLVRDADEARVLAHFYSNLGVESLAAGEPRRALANLRLAIASDGSFGWAWSNLGVVYRVLGQPDRAEEAYLEAYRLDPTDVTPLSNLASLYAGQGKELKAARFQHKVERHRRRNPFHHYRLSLLASAAGDPRAAIVHMRRATRRAPDDPRFWTRLAELYRADGRPRRAERSLEQALRHSRDPDQRQRLERRLAEWRSGRGDEAVGDGEVGGGGAGEGGGDGGAR